MDYSRATRKNANGLAALIPIALFQSCATAQSCTEAVVTSHAEAPMMFTQIPAADCEIAVGEDEILVCSNAFFVLHDKTGQKITNEQEEIGDYPSAQGNVFFTRVGASFLQAIGDPVVLYDYHSERYWVVADEVGFDLYSGKVLPDYTHYRLAVSNSTPSVVDPTTWLFFDQNIFEVPDPPPTNPKFKLVHNQMIAADQTALYAVAKHDYYSSPTATADTTSIIHVWDKASLLQNTLPTPAVLYPADAGDDSWGHAPAVLYGNWDHDHPMYVVATPEKPGLPSQNLQETVRVGAVIHDGQGTYTYTWIDLPDTSVEDWFDHVGAIDTASTNNLEVISSRFLHATYVPGEDSGRIWCALHVTASDGGSTPAPTGGAIVRWYEIETNGWPYITNATPSLVQEGEISGGGYEYCDPAIAVSSAGHVGLAWTRVSSTTYPEFFMGYLNTGGSLISESKQTSTFVRASQKADYAGCDPDPLNPCKFWGHSPLGQSNTAWETHVASICVEIGSCAPAQESLSQPADYNCDGVSDTLDALIFADLVAKGSKAADLNGSGAIDAGDVKEFEARTEKGQKK